MHSLASNIADECLFRRRSYWWGANYRNMDFHSFTLIKRRLVKETVEAGNILVNGSKKKGGADTEVVQKHQNWKCQDVIQNLGTFGLISFGPKCKVASLGLTKLLPPLNCAPPSTMTDPISVYQYYKRKGVQ